MSSAPVMARIARLVSSSRSDQRAHQRYPITLEVDYRLINKGQVTGAGSGKTVNMSSGGVCFNCAGPLPVSGLIELIVRWPFLLEGACPLSLVMRGRIVRSDEVRTAVYAKQHEFRTAKRASRSMPDKVGGRSMLG